MMLRILSILLLSITAVGATVDDTHGYLSAMSDFLESHQLGDTELERVIAGCEKGEMVNPILQSAADINPLTLVYREALQSWIAPGKLDAAAVCEFAKSRLSDEARKNEERKQAKQTTRELASTQPSTLVAGDFFNCAIQDDHTVACWGDNSKGQTIPPPDLGPVKSLSAGSDHACAIRTDDTVRCWGQGKFVVNIAPPSDLGTVKAVSSGIDHACAIRTDDTVRCWGKSGYYKPHKPPRGLGPVFAITSGGEATCAISTDKTVTCWAGDDYWFLGTAQAVSILSNLITCITRLDNTLSCEGIYENALSQETGGLKAFSFGSFHGCAIRKDDTLFCFGKNENFYGEFTGQATPPANIGPVKEVAVGIFHTCARKQDNTVSCFGFKGYHDNVTTPPASLVQPPMPKTSAPAHGWMQLPVVAQVMRWWQTKQSSGAEP